MSQQCQQYKFCLQMGYKFSQKNIVYPNILDKYTIHQFLRIMGEVACCGPISDNEPDKSKFLAECIRRIKLQRQDLPDNLSFGAESIDPQTNLKIKLLKNQHKSEGFLYAPGKLLYFGQLKDKKANGQGILIWRFQEGDFVNTISQFKGNFENNKAQGFGSYENPQMSFDGGKWNNGFPQKGKLKYKNPQNYVDNKPVIIQIKLISFKNAELSRGYIELRVPQNYIYKGDIVKKGSYYHFSGQGNMIFLATGDTYTGQWKEGKFHGKGKYLWKSQRQFVGNYQFGLKNGEGVQKYKNLTYKGNWEKGVKHGEFQVTKQSMPGKITYRCHYQHGKIEQSFENPELFNA